MDKVAFPTFFKLNLSNKKNCDPLSSCALQLRVISLLKSVIYAVGQIFQNEFIDVLYTVMIVVLSVLGLLTLSSVSGSEPLPPSAAFVTDCDAIRYHVCDHSRNIELSLKPKNYF